MKMEPNNIEKQFRDKLNSREIKPSVNSWDRLDAMLAIVDPSVSELAKQKRKRNYRWIYFAASFLGFILIATVFFNQTEEVIDSEHKTVGVEKQEIQHQENEWNKVLENPVIHTNTEVVAATQNGITTHKSTSKIKLTELSNKTETLNKDKKHPIEIALVSNDKMNSSSIISQKNAVRVDANALLASVDQEKPSQALSKNAVAVQVNSNELLSEVDDELELSFRERVLKSVNKTYKEVKVAVAKRNLE